MIGFFFASLPECCDLDMTQLLMVIEEMLQNHATPNIEECLSMFDGCGSASLVAVLALDVQMST